MNRCPICTAEYFPKHLHQATCGDEVCKAELKKQQAKKKKQLKEYRAAKEKLKTRRDHLKDAQNAFNAYIRFRDRDLPCISCGRFHGGAYDAGHYRSVGAAPQLRYDERNVHKQCVPCNQWKSGNAIEYRIRLIERIGMDAVEEIERANEVKKWTIEEAKAIKAEYRAKLKTLKEQSQ